MSISSSKFIRGSGALRRFVLGPLCVLYYYYYANYLRLGRNEKYAKDWASAVASMLLAGPYLWIGFFLVRLYKFFLLGNFFMIVDESWVIPAVIIAIVIHLLVSYMLDFKRLLIINEFCNVKLPSFGRIVLVVTLFGGLLIFIVGGLTKHHFLLATGLMLGCYSAFHFAYFDPILRQLTKSDETQIKGQVHF